MNKNRVIALNSVNEKKGPVIYWMSRDQRINSNWSLIYAQLIAEKKREDFAVIFNLVPDFLEAGYRQYDFMIKGLQKIEYKLEEKNIPFYILSGNPKKSIVQFLKSINAGALITDFDPLKIKRKWQSEVNKLINIPFYLVDAHNIVSCWQTSQKQEFGAYTIRPKIIRKLNEYLDNFPEIRFQKLKYLLFRKNNWKKIIDSLNINCDVNNATPFIPGEDIAHNQFKHFLLEKLDKYAENRNNPNIDASSNLSVYLHFGQISSQYVALEIIKNYEKTENTEAFLEELIVRKELSDNYCYYNENYDSYEGFPEWAKQTLKIHRYDEREYVYELIDFESANTHDDLWNAAQIELIETGKIHGYMRMYWAKKILEWTKSPEKALKTAIYLNDKYVMDGRDPNGYTGCAWAIGGVHDRAWSERPVFGKIRYMNYSGAKRKFDVEKYISKYLQ